MAKTKDKKWIKNIGKVIALILGIYFLGRGLYHLGLVPIFTITTRTTTLITTTTKPEVKSTYKIGDKASDGRLAIKVDNIRYTKKIDEQNSEFWAIAAPKGKKYLIIDLTVENLQTEKRETVGRLDSKIYSSEGYVSREESGIQLNYLANPFPFGDNAYILPNSKVRGEIPYEIFDDATGLKVVFTYTYALFTDEWVVTFSLE